MSFKQLCEEWFDAPEELCWYVMGYVEFQPRIVYMAPGQHYRTIVDHDHVIFVNSSAHTLVNVRTGREYVVPIPEDMLLYNHKSHMVEDAKRIMRDVGEPAGIVDAAECDKKLDSTETPIFYQWSYDIVLYACHESKFYVGILDDIVPMQSPWICNRIDSLVPVQPATKACVCDRNIVFIGNDLINGTFYNVTTREQWTWHDSVQQIGSYDGMIVVQKDYVVYYYDVDERHLRRLPPSDNINLDKLAMCQHTRACTSCKDNELSRFVDLSASEFVSIYDGILRILIIVRCDS